MLQIIFLGLLARQSYASPKMLCYSAQPNAYFSDHAREVAKIYDGFYFSIGTWDAGVLHALGLPGTPQVEPTFPDDAEYLCCKMLGNNAGLSMLGGVDEQNLTANPLFKPLVGIIQQYENLRHQNYFDDLIRTRLRQPGKEFTLFQANGAWYFKLITYQKHKVTGLAHPSARWTVHDPFESQPVKLRIEPLLAVRPFDDSAGVILADFSRASEFSFGGSAAGVSGGINFTVEKSMDGGAGGLFSAVATHQSPREGSWLKMEKKFDPWLNLEKKQGLGVWIKGDGHGQLLNLRIESPKHLSHGARGDHYVKIDFSGWKYFELVEIESAEFSNYLWSDSGFYVYDSYRHTVQFAKIDQLQLWYNNLPAGKTANCVLGPVKALPLVPISSTNHGIVVGEARLIFPVKMKSGMYLEFRSAGDCKLFGSKGDFLQDVQITGKIPELKPGENQILFIGEGPAGINSRVQVTVISEGKPIEKQ